MVRHRLAAHPEYPGHPELRVVAVGPPPGHRRQLRPAERALLRPEPLRPGRRVALGRRGNEGPDRRRDGDLMQWRMEELMPEWDHREVHERWMAASPEAVWDALWELRVRDLSVTTALARLRGGPSAWRRGGGADAGDHGDVRVMDAM